MGIIKNFNIDIAINDMGNCHNQKVDCETCFVGKTILKSKGKDRIDDLCDKDIVFFCAKLLKSYRDSL